MDKYISTIYENCVFHKCVMNREEYFSPSDPYMNDCWPGLDSTKKQTLLGLRGLVFRYFDGPVWIRSALRWRITALSFVKHRIGSATTRSRAQPAPVLGLALRASPVTGRRKAPVGMEFLSVNKFFPADAPI